DLPLSVQVMLLQLLETGRYSPLGGDQTLHVETQIVTATNVDLRQLIQAGRFREDLMHRMGRVSVRMPPLRERADDIPLLVKLFLKRKNLSSDLLDDSAAEWMCRHTWPGNIRELRTVVDTFALLHLTGADNLGKCWQQALSRLGFDATPVGIAPVPE